MADETPHEAFERIRDNRVPKAEHAIKLIGNLGERRYQATEAEKRAIADRLYDAVDEIADKFGFPASIEGELAASGIAAQQIEDVQQVTSEDGDDEVDTAIMGDVRWALEMLQRGERKEAVTMLKRAVARHWDLHGRD